jgi:pectate lyase
MKATQQALVLIAFCLTVLFVVNPVKTSDAADLAPPKGLAIITQSPDLLPTAPKGFASVSQYGQDGTTGGAGGEVVKATTWEELSDYAGRNGRYVIEISGTIKNEDKLYVKSDKTLLGMGTNATLLEISVRIEDAHNVIIQNLNFGPITRDNKDHIQISDESHHVWVDHSSFIGSTDGLIDVVDSDYITISWNKFSDHYKNMLFYGTTRSPKVTLHHNYMYNLYYRTPQIRDGGQCHLFNNYYDVYKSDAVRVRSEATALVENNYWYKVEKPYVEDGGTIKEVGNIYVDSGSFSVSGEGFIPPYNYALENPADLPSTLPSAVGPR